MATLHKKFDISCAKNTKIVSSHEDFEALLLLQKGADSTTKLAVRKKLAVRQTKLAVMRSMCLLTKAWKMRSQKLRSSLQTGALRMVGR